MKRRNNNFASWCILILTQLHKTAVFLCIAFVFSNLAFHLDDGSLTSSGSWRKDVRDQGRYHGYMAVPIFLAAWLARACQARASIYDKESAEFESATVRRNVSQVDIEEPVQMSILFLKSALM